MNYRQEYKYLISPAEKALLERRLRHAMQPDPYAVSEGTYTVRSLYFDDPYDSAMRDSFYGVPEKAKYRLRIYNMDEGFLRLEKKIKKYDGCVKQEALLSKEECDMLIRGDPGFMLNREEPFMRQCYAEFRSKNLRPREIIQYDRTAFQCVQGNTRVTIDSDIRTSELTDAFFKNGLALTPLPTDGVCVLEVKYNHFLPDHVKMLLSVIDRTRVAFSKYAGGRLYY